MRLIYNGYTAQWLRAFVCQKCYKNLGKQLNVLLTSVQPKTTFFKPITLRQPFTNMLPITINLLIFMYRIYGFPAKFMQWIESIQHLNLMRNMKNPYIFLSEATLMVILYTCYISHIIIPPPVPLRHPHWYSENDGWARLAHFIYGYIYI